MPAPNMKLKTLPYLKTTVVSSSRKAQEYLRAGKRELAQRAQHFADVAHAELKRRGAL